jgi:hypothetical protein
MAKLLIDGVLYQSLSSTAFFEDEYEILVLRGCASLFPQHYAVPFKKLVESEDGRAMPDLALIEKSYRKWWVVEIELAHHSLTRHVLPQVAVLANAVYARDVATYLSQQSNELHPPSLENMMKGSQPQVLVIANSLVPDWVQPLSSYGALLAAVEVFRSDRNKHALRLNGACPRELGDEISTLRFDPLIPRLMIVDSPGGLQSSSDKRLLIELDGAITEWTVIPTKDRVWLSPVKANPLVPGHKYALLKDDDGRLKLQPVR